jgi:bacterioferritin (cytochrome b1)
MEPIIHARENHRQILDVLGARLSFERNGVRLYQRVIEKIERGGDARYHRLLEMLRHIRDEEKEHEEWLEEQVRARGGDAHGTTEMALLETEESRGIENVIVDGHDKVLHLLHALLAAELADNAGWDLLVRLADATGDRKARKGFMKRMLQEAEHLAFIREAVVKGAQIELLGLDEMLPASAARVMARPAAVGGALGVLLVLGGAAIAAGVLIASPKLVFRARCALGL